MGKRQKRYAYMEMSQWSLLYNYYLLIKTFFKDHGLQPDDFFIESDIK
jgi:hypothetical protein